MLYEGWDDISADGDGFAIEGWGLGAEGVGFAINGGGSDC